MKRRIPIYLLVAMVLSMCVSACNDDSDDPGDVIDPARNAVMITSFNLQKNDSILSNLDSVYFSIDLDRAVVFNADSLPKGTRVNRLQLNIGLSTVKKAEITMPGSKGQDTVVNYLTNSTDSIDFSRGSVKLHLESASGDVTRDYTIFVNVHKMDPDKMAWGDLQGDKLPTSLSNAVAQRTVEFGKEIICFSQQGSSFCRAITSNPDNASWSKSSVTLPAGAKLSTLTAGATKLFVTDAADKLYESADKGITWTATGASMTYIYGCIADKAIGNLKGASGYTYVTYPASTTSAVSADAPVELTSQALTYTTEWSENPMLIVSGGKTAARRIVGGTWAYDGTQWANITLNSLPALQAPAVVPYFAYKTSAAWRVTKQSVLLAFGGLLSDGTDNKKTYISYDMGVHWTVASDLMQLPANIAVGRQADAIVFTQRKTATPSARWNEIAAVQLPVWYEVQSQATGRAVAPVTEWDCPYIYVFGGINASDALNKNIWRGVINRLTFKPLQ